VITTVAFDADDTLVDTRNAVTVAFAALLAHLNEPQLTVDLFHADSREHWAAMPERPATEIRTAATRYTLARVGRDAETDAMVELFFEIRFANSRPYPGTVEVLEKLRADYRLGYATNGNSRSERCGLGGRFDFELYALVDGVPKKPAVRFYEEMARLAGVRPYEIIYVGDNYEHDVVGPASFGMRTVWLNRAGAPVPGPVRPDAVIENLSELTRILAG
jgi:FMN hydrolase / 5-amino-6-(5-phospho-D-ribitylamino)uracil phosphatase